MSKIPGVVPPFHAYSPSGLVEAEIVYAGYARVEDFIYLSNNNINVSGKVVIAKYGAIFRGDMVNNAANAGAVGIITYTDPMDYAGGSVGSVSVYPETWWLPSSGAQRGTVFVGIGDPLTPGYPSNNLAYRYPEDQVEPHLPRIPSHPIGYGAAYNILKEMRGAPVPTTRIWGGALNITYRFGPGFNNPQWKIQLNVTSRNERAKAENVFGIIKGTVEPDRYVLFGNHRDAWIYGAVDPSSGTAILMEMSRVMGEMVKKGEWKPRRSIIFCSWGAEEYGLLGSNEWAEQYVATLRERAVAYINVDIAVQGNATLRAAATPLMYNIIYEAAQKIPNPDPSEIQSGRPTVYDTWLKYLPWKDINNEDMGVPSVRSLGSGSDYAPLLQLAGITSVDLSYLYDNNIYGVPSYPLYHTEYETFEIVGEQFDRDYQYHLAIARTSAEIARRLADSLILPMNVSNYATGLERLRQQLHKDHGQTLNANLDNYGALQEVIAGFAEDVAEFQHRLKTIDKGNPFEVRAVNDQILLLEKAFLEPTGLPYRPWKKHILFAESSYNSYAGTSFPGLIDLLFQIDKEPARWEQVRHYFSVILHTIQSAGATLRDVTRFMSETL